MPNNNINVLITRPEQEGRVLAATLNNSGIHTLCQPLFDYQLNEKKENLLQLLSQDQQPIIIFISVASVTYANKAHPIAMWPTSKIIAVGNATSKALMALNINAITPTEQTSEGLLELPELQNVGGEKIIIVRGDGGREHLAQSLKLRQATVYYFEAYQRIWRQLDSNIAQHWRNNKINCIVITSDALLQSVVQLMNLSDSTLYHYWQNNCYWVVASDRIAQRAKALGLKHVINARGANDKAISDAILSNIMFSDVIINTEQDDDR